MNARLYCRALTSFNTNVPLCVDGVTVVPGDYVFAHGSAAVIVPAASAEAILKKSREIMVKMDRVKDSLVNEDPKTVLSEGSSEI